MSAPQILRGDCRTILPTLPEESVQCVVTSPPYWGLRDYGESDQIGLEATPEEYVAEIVGVFCEVRRVLKDDGTLWLNLGDSYASSPPGNTTKGVSAASTLHGVESDTYRTTLSKSVQTKRNTVVGGLKPKDLVGIPRRVAFALQSDGWFLRSDIIWHKPNPMPESVTDRPTKAHEYLFLLTKRAKYCYDAEAIREPHADKQGVERFSTSGGSSKEFNPGGNQGFHGNGFAMESGGREYNPNGRNKRSVWTVPTAPYKEAHFATFPPDLIKPCVMAGTKLGDTVLDPFGGSGTTGQVASELGRKSILIELNDEYADLSEIRTNVTPGLPL